MVIVSPRQLDCNAYLWTISFCLPMLSLFLSLVRNCAPFNYPAAARRTSSNVYKPFVLSTQTTTTRTTHSATSRAIVKHAEMRATRHNRNDCLSNERERADAEYMFTKWSVYLSVSVWFVNSFSAWCVTLYAPNNISCAIELRAQTKWTLLTH